MRSFAYGMYATPAIADQLMLGQFVDGLDKQQACRKGLRLPLPVEVKTSSSVCSARGSSEAFDFAEVRIVVLPTQRRAPIYS